MLEKGAQLAEYFLFLMGDEKKMYNWQQIETACSKIEGDTYFAVFCVYPDRIFAFKMCIIMSHHLIFQNIILPSTKNACFTEFWSNHNQHFWCINARKLCLIYGRWNKRCIIDSFFCLRILSQDRIVFEKYAYVTSFNIFRNKWI